MQSSEVSQPIVLLNQQLNLAEEKYKSLYELVTTFIDDIESDLHKCANGEAKYPDFINELEENLTIFRGDIEI